MPFDLYTTLERILGPELVPLTLPVDGYIVDYTLENLSLEIDANALAADVMKKLDDCAPYTDITSLKYEYGTEIGGMGLTMTFNPPLISTLAHHVFWGSLKDAFADAHLPLDINTIEISTTQASPANGPRHHF